MDAKQDRIAKYKAKLVNWDNDYSPYAGYADDILCELLKVLDYGEVVELYCKLRDEYYE